MLEAIGVGSTDELFADIPAELRLDRPLELPDGLSETEVFDQLAALAARNADADSETCFIGAGMYDHYVPALVDAIVSRSEFLTPYTPVPAGGLAGRPAGDVRVPDRDLGAHRAAGRQRLAVRGAVVGRLRRLPGARRAPRAATAWSSPAACTRTRARRSSTYARGFGAEVVEVGPRAAGSPTPASSPHAIDDRTRPRSSSRTRTSSARSRTSRRSPAAAHDAGALCVAAVDAITLGVLRPPGECGVDIAVGEGQPLGNRLDFGGPSFGFFAAAEEHLRRMPGRIAGETTDADGRRGFVLALQTREQHIRREKATHNICTSQALNALAGTDLPRLARAAAGSSSSASCWSGGPPTRASG